MATFHLQIVMETYLHGTRRSIMSYIKCLWSACSHGNIPAEFPGVLSEEGIPTTDGPIIDEDDIPGVMEHRAATNAGLLDDVLEGMPDMVPHEQDEILANTIDDNDNRIIAIRELPPWHQHQRMW